MESPRKWVTIDTETTIYNRGPDAIGSQQASPFYPSNRIVLLGFREGEADRVSLTEPRGKTLCRDGWGGYVLVGQNIAFDLHYLRKRYPDLMDLVDRTTIWDTMIAEYVLSGQQSKMWSLDKLAKKYGGTIKDDKIKEYWARGIETENIPVAELTPYLEADVNNTEKVFLQQYLEAEERGMLPLIEMLMESRLATWEMEWNGMHVDTVEFTQKRADTLDDLSRVEVLLMMEIRKHLPELIPNPSSNDHISWVLFGGEYSVVEDVPVINQTIGEPVRYKSGKRKGEVKTRKEKVAHTTKGLGVVPFTDWRTTKDGVYSSKEDVLKHLLRICEGNPGHWAEVITFVKLVLTHRGLAKEYGTYFEGYGKLIFPDHCIHPQYNHAVTHTGRLSSSKPNLQNVVSTD